MPRFKLTLEYDGADFEGWQQQPEGRRTVQGVLRSVLTETITAPEHLVGAGRTDAGVHAEGQVAGVQLETRIEAAELLRALNARLPADLAVRSCVEAAADFDARRDARSKLYRYRVWNGALRSPLRRRRSAWVRGALDLPAMQRAAAALVGFHDFSSLAAAGGALGDARRRLTRFEVGGENGAELYFEVEGEGFLRHMVRNAVGTLLQVGAGQRAPDSMPGLLAAKSRAAAGPTAPAHGLTLVRVDYGEPGP